MAKIIFSKGSVGANLVADPGMELDNSSPDWDDYDSPFSNLQSSVQAHSGTYSRQVVLSSPNLIGDPDMELDDGSWIAYNSPVSQAQSADYAHSGTYSRKIVPGVGSTGIEQNSSFAVTPGKTYRVIVWIYNPDGVQRDFWIRTKTGAGTFYTAQLLQVPAGSWALFTDDYVETTGGANANIQIWNNATASAFYVDEVSVIELSDTTGGITGDPSPFATVSGSTYTGGVWIYNTGAAQDFTVKVRNGAASGDLFSVTVEIPQNIWTEVDCGSLLESAGGSGAYVYVYATGQLTYYVDDVDFHLIPTSFTFSVARVFPINDPLKTNVVIDYSDGGQLYAYDKGILEQFFNLEYKRLSEADYDNLVNWYQNISVGALNTFTYTDEGSVDHTVRWLNTQLSIPEHEKERRTGSIQLREEV